MKLWTTKEIVDSPETIKPVVSLNPGITFKYRGNYPVVQTITVKTKPSELLVQEVCVEWSNGHVEIQECYTAVLNQMYRDRIQPIGVGASIAMQDFKDAATACSQAISNTFKLKKEDL